MPYQEDIITLKELILKLREFWRELWRMWWVIAICVLIFSIFFIYKYSTTETTYTAELTFMVDSNEGGGFGGVSAVLAQFGLGGGKSRSNLDKILAIAKSRRIVYDVLLKKVEIDGKLDFFGNHLIDIEELRENWKDSEVNGLPEFKFASDDLVTADQLRDGVLNTLYGIVVGGPKSTSQILIADYNEDTGIMNLSANSTSELFAARFTDSLYNHLSKYYIEKTTQKAEKTYKVFKQKTDSIYQNLLGKQYTLANIQDVDRASYLRVSRLSRDRLIGEIQILTQGYAESYKNTEIAAIDLEMKTPYITTIDRPRIPLSINEPSIIRNLIIGILLGCFLGVGIVLIRKVFRDALT